MSTTISYIVTHLYLTILKETSIIYDSFQSGGLIRQQLEVCCQHKVEGKNSTARAIMFEQL